MAHYLYEVSLIRPHVGDVIRVEGLGLGFRV